MTFEDHTRYVFLALTCLDHRPPGFPISGFQVDAVDQVVLNLQDEVQQSWKPGDQIVVASTDYSMHQAEEFTLLPCPHCTSRQVRIQGKRTGGQRRMCVHCRRLKKKKIETELTRNDPIHFVGVHVGFVKFLLQLKSEIETCWCIVLV